MQNKGFTLIEAILVLSVLSLLCACFPFIKLNSSLSLHYSLQELYHKLLYVQNQSLVQKRKISVSFQEDRIEMGHQGINFGTQLHCSAQSFHFTAIGTVSKATSIKCSFGDATGKIILELGAGRIYVK